MRFKFHIRRKKLNLFSELNISPMVNSQYKGKIEFCDITEKQLREELKQMLDELP